MSKQTPKQFKIFPLHSNWRKCLISCCMTSDLINQNYEETALKGNTLQWCLLVLIVNGNLYLTRKHKMVIKSWKYCKSVFYFLFGFLFLDAAVLKWHLVGVVSLLNILRYKKKPTDMTRHLVSDDWIKIINFSLKDILQMLYVVLLVS